MRTSKKTTPKPISAIKNALIIICENTPTQAFIINKTATERHKKVQIINKRWVIFLSRIFNTFLYLISPAHTHTSMAYKKSFKVVNSKTPKYIFCPSYSSSS